MRITLFLSVLAVIGIAFVIRVLSWVRDAPAPPVVREARRTIRHFERRLFIADWKLKFLSMWRKVFPRRGHWVWWSNFDAPHPRYTFVFYLPPDEAKRIESEIDAAVRRLRQTPGGA